MNWQRDKVLIIVSAVSLVLTAVAGFFVFKFSTAFTESRDQLESTKSSIRRLAGEGIEPSDENYELLKENLIEVTKFKDEKLAWLRERQFEAIPLAPIDFTSEVAKRVSEWEKLTKQMSGEEEAAATETNDPNALVEADARPQDFWGGFENYGRAGRPPDETHVPRLTLQLQTVDLLVQILLRNKVDQLVSISRETSFERVVSAEPAPGASNERGDEEEAELPLYESEDYSLEFRASEAAVWDVLEALAASPQHITVTKVLFRNENAELQPALEEKVTAVTANRAAPRRRTRVPGATGAPDVKKDPFAPKPVAAGQEKVFATIDLKVYRFPAPPVEDDGEGEEQGDPEGAAVSRAVSNSRKES